MADPDKTLSAIDILVNRQNLALARSQKLLQSWLPPKPSSTQTQPTSTSDDESDFQDLGEATGIGAKRKNGSDSELGGILKRRRTDNDKLLENLIGKKAAQARKKALEGGKGKHAAPKVVEVKKTVGREAESEDEGEGRASAFTSKKKKATKRDAEVPLDAVGGVEEVDALDADAEPPDPREDGAVVKEVVVKSIPDVEEDEEERPKKRKAGSYLDELLAEKAKKKKKNKKGKAAV